MELVVGALSRAVAAVSSVLPITQPTQPDSLESSSTGSGTSSSTSLLAWWQQQPPPPASSRRVNTDWREAFLKGVAWSPDGTCILAGAADNNVRLFELPASLYDVSSSSPPSAISFEPTFAIKHAETVYDYAWYPLMSSAVPATCCFVTTARDQPVRLWDAFTGKTRCSYTAFDHMDEVAAANSLTFSPTGTHIYCGFQRAVRVFDVSRPGRQVATFESKSRHLGAQAGIISTIAVSPHTNLIAAGSYDKTVGIYDNAGSMVQLLRLPAPNTGVTQVKLAPSGTHVFAGVRKGNHVSCWDLRYVTAEPMAQFARQCTTNQRIQFDLDASCSVLVTGCETGHAIGYDLSSSFHEVFRVRSHNDVVNAVGCHPMLPLLATASGSREFDLRPFVDDGDVDSDDEQQQQHVNEPSLEPQQQQCAPSHSLALWRVASLQLLTADVVTHAVIEATATAEIEPVAPLIVDASSIHEPSA